MSPSKRPKTSNASQELRRYSVSLSAENHLRARRTIVDLAGEGVETTVSGLLEIGLVELLKRKDLASVLQSHGARSRRR